MTHQQKGGTQLSNGDRLVLNGDPEHNKQVFRLLRSCLSQLTPVQGHEARSNGPLPLEYLDYWRSRQFSNPIFQLRRGTPVDSGFYHDGEYFVFDRSQVKALEILFMVPAKMPGGVWVTFVGHGEGGRASAEYPVRPVSEKVVHALADLSRIADGFEWRFSFSMASDV
ncbi:hypothetical protein OOT46_09125 [Aquabacterium sp. A7-Y]|uniref:hypothetical protein n=1 Tax=Aquabacterium sp. A7-Y TaxID=1349605 RepID=UPI00223D0BDD|nr:hypothetical protein [Aquabacterium sp. A7-Y]MCW7538009.1 hypothetical protein [Aquabacterium sp. A7-Y]